MNKISFMLVQYTQTNIYRFAMMKLLSLIVYSTSIAALLPAKPMLFNLFFYRGTSDRLRACHGTFLHPIGRVLLSLLVEQNSIFNHKHFVVFLSLQPGLKLM